MKKVLVVATLQKTIKGFLIPHVKKIEENGYEVWLAANCSEYLDKKELKDNKWINIEFSRNPFSFSSLKALDQIRKLLSEEKFEFIHLHTPIAAFIGRMAARSLKLKNIIYIVHGFHFHDGAPIFNWILYYPIEYIAMRWTDIIITINQEDFTRAQKMSGKRTKVYKIDGVGINNEKFYLSDEERKRYRKKLSLKDSDFVIVSVAELNKNKNHIQVLRSLKLLMKEYDSIKYFIVGKGPLERKLKLYCKKNGLSDIVFFLGQVNKVEVSRVLNMSDILISASIREGLGVNVVEAMAAGRPVVVTKNRGHKEIVEEYKNGLFVPIGSYEKMKNAIAYMYINKEERKKMGEKAREMAKKFEITKVLNKLEEINYMGDDNEKSIASNNEQ